MNSEVICFHERNNPYDMFAIQVCQLETNKKVELLSMEISRISNFLLDNGAAFQAKVTSTHYHQSPLVRGGLKVSCEVTTKLTKGECTKALLE